MKRFLLILTLFLVFAAPLYVFAIDLNLDYPEFGGVDLNRKDDQGLDRLAKWFYTGIVIISGLAAFVMLVWGGVRWMSSAGSPTAISDAKDRIQKALLGLLLVLASFLILQVINPELTVLNIPGAPAPKSTAIPAPADPAVASPGSSGAPAPGQQAQCRGPGSYETSTKTSLQQAADAICTNNNGKTPLDADIHFFLASGSGPTGCTTNDVKSVHDLLLKSCGAAPGEVVGTIRIDQTTVPARLCSYSPGLIGTSGLIYESPRIAPNLITYVSSGGPKPTGLLSKIQQNTAAFVQHCSEAKNKDKQYCFLQNRSTQIGSFDIPQKAALAQYCYDIIP